MYSNGVTNINTTKLISIFFPLKPLRNKFSDNFIATQIANFVPKIGEYSEKAIVYKIDKERFYTYDLKKEKFEDNSEIVDNQTIVIIFSVEKSENVDISSVFEEDFLKSVNTIRVHRKKVENLGFDSKPSYVFYTINSTRLLNSLIPIIQAPDSTEDKSKTFFVLSANNANRDIDPMEKSFSTEKVCRCNYITTVDFKSSEQKDLNWTKSFKRKINAQIKN